MKTENAELMRQAREALSGKWRQAIGTYFIYLLISSFMTSVPMKGLLLPFGIVSRIGSLVIGGPLVLGLIGYTLSLSRGENSRMEQLFDGFKRFEVALKTYLWMLLFVFLRLLLLIFPGIIAMFSFSLTFYILADDENIRPREAIEKSEKMMEGYRWKLFFLYCRFIGWFLLCLLTLGIGLLWLIPYAAVSNAKFYEDVKRNYELNIVNEELKIKSEE